MPTIPTLTKRNVKGSAITHDEEDQNKVHIENAINGLHALFAAVFNPNGTLRDGAISSTNMFAAGVYNAIVDIAFPLGSILWSTNGNVPSSLWLPADGLEISRTTYANYFALVGTTYGAGNGSTTFNGPDLRGRTSIGEGTGAGLTARTIGQQLGAETHTLTASEMPVHSHGITIECNNSDASGSGDSVTGGADNAVSPRPDATYTTDSDDAGGGSAHENMQPSLVLYAYVKVLTL